MSGLLDRHLEFLEALRGAGMPVSLAEGLDAVAALSTVGWHDRAMVRDAYAATLVKKHLQRPTFDALFELYFPRLVGDGVQPPSGEGVEDFRERLLEALADTDDDLLARLAAEAVGEFGEMPDRTPGLSRWSAYVALQEVDPASLAGELRRTWARGGGREGIGTRLGGDRPAARRIGRFTQLVGDDARRRIAEEKGPKRLADVATRPSIDRLSFLSARPDDIAEMRREARQLARRLATRLTKRQRGRRGALDFRRTVRASMSTGGVPLQTRHRPKRPHRSDLVVLCDVSGSVANFAQFTLLLVHVLREQFTSLRAFTFVDNVHEVTDSLRPGRDETDVMTELAASAQYAALWGSTNYGRALSAFAEQHADIVGPKTVLLILGDARSNHSFLSTEILTDLNARARHVWWLNPEPRGDWGMGDSAAPTFADIVPMVECRNLAHLGAFVEDLAG